MTSTNKEIAQRILRHLNIPMTEQHSEEVVDRVAESVEQYAKKNIDSFNLNKVTFQGESKKFYVHENLALVQLKPTMYSFTHNRYGTVEGTDALRIQFWKYFARELNSQMTQYIYKGSKDTHIQDIIRKGLIKKDFPFVSNLLGTITHNNTPYAIVYFAESIPPIEVVWKQYMVGTMKHNLKCVDRFPKRNNETTVYEGKMPEIIRFDWRNPLPDKDECIPDDFADHYMNTHAAKPVALAVSRMINNILQKKGYELVDLCYFMNEEGNLIHSEITPDGMRIKQREKSFDKDLWRQGKDKETIVEVWTELLEDVKTCCA